MGGNPSAKVAYRYVPKRGLFDQLIGRYTKHGQRRPCILQRWLCCTKDYGMDDNALYDREHVSIPIFDQCLPPMEEFKTHLICLVLTISELTESTRYATTELLLESGASWNVLHEEKLTPLYLADRVRSAAQPSVSDLLKSHGARLQVEDLAHLREWDLDYPFTTVRRAALEGFFDHLHANEL